jgi:hypothetical protein
MLGCDIKRANQTPIMLKIEELHHQIKSIGYLAATRQHSYIFLIDFSPSFWSLKNISIRCDWLRTTLTAESVKDHDFGCVWLGF